MPICVDCGSSYADTLVVCPTCGKANPTAQPAPLVCPSCGRTDQLLKVSEAETNPDPQNSGQLEKLSFPPRPHAPEINAPLTIMGVLLMFAALFGLIRVRTGSGPLIFAVCMVIAVICFLRGRVNSKQAAAYMEELKKWRDAKARWDELNYCPSCQQVFLPGQNAASPSDRIAEYLPGPRQ
ncbi:MAG: hypothetical protein P4L50_28895 [Anaerolineaceae bacterium]|nr:hypothetical protein [Anaerolineaceae bacterium]